MSFLICMVAVCPLRAEATHRSEQVSQMLFGEICELLERSKDFVLVRILNDNYEGWCQHTQLEQTEMGVIYKNKRLAGEWVNKITINEQVMHIPFGSSLTFLTEAGLSGKCNISYEGISINPGADTINMSLVKKLTYTFLNTPYLWGGRSVFGIDCSGFTQLVFQCMNISMPRDAYQQAALGETVESFEEAKCGDLAFFDNEEGKISHTGILLDSNTIIHASGKVRIDAIDDTGIVNRDTGNKTHRLKIIKRVMKI